MERDVFISKGGVNYGAGLTLATSGFWDITSLTAGGLAVFNDDQSVVDGTATVLASDITGDYIYVAVNSGGGGGIRRSTRIHRKSFKYVKKAYAAPVAAVKVLGNEVTGSTSTYGSLNLPSSLSVGDRVGVAIRDRSKSHEDTAAIKTYEFYATTGDLLSGTGAKNIITKLVALVNADSDAIVTAVAQTDGTNNDAIKFTSDTAGSDFDIVLVDGVLKDADILEYASLNRVYTSGLTTTPVENVTGHGTPAQATAAEAESDVRTGETNTQRLSKYMYTRPTDVVSSATYTVYSLYWTDPNDSPENREGNYKQLLQIYCPSGETGVGEVITVLDDIFALVNP